MKKIGIFYGSSTGTCEGVAEQLAQKLGVANSDVHSAEKVSNGQIATYDVLILGTSTWGEGELQDDWYDAIKVFKTADLSEKTVALFGCGDSESYSDTFCDGIGILYQSLKNSGCTFIGNHVSTEGYNFSNSVAEIDGEFVGLPIDEMNESDKTEARIDAWVTNLAPNL